MRLLYFLFIFCEIIFAKRTADILFLTDIHLDILYDSQSPTSSLCRNLKAPFNVTISENDYGKYDCDTPTTLLNSMVSNLRQKYSTLDLIILNGDQIAHNLFKIDLGDIGKNKQVYHDTFALIYKMLKMGYPEATILPTIGNNDFYEHYTTPTPDSLKEQTDFFKSLYFNSENMDMADLNTDHDESISDGMYYSYRLGDTKFIMLNSVVFTVKNKRFDPVECDRQLHWLEKELDSPEKKIISMHVPPYPFFFENKTDFLMNETVLKKFDDLMYKYRDNILNVLSSHLHWMKFGIRAKTEYSDFVFHQTTLPETDMDRFINTVVRSKKILNRSKQVRASLTKYFNIINFAALSPIYFNNPTYSIIEYDIDRHRIDNIKTFSADLNKTLAHDQTLNWSIQYNLKKDLGFRNFDNDDIYDFVYRRYEDVKIEQLLPYFLGASPRYEEFYKDLLLKRGMYDTDDGLRKFLCSFREIFEDDLKKCEEAFGL
jgi:hypothetical protein